jgi:hypothetical protein
MICRNLLCRGMHLPCVADIFTVYRSQHRHIDPLVNVKLSVTAVSKPRKAGTIVFIFKKNCRNYVKVKRGNGIEG